MEHSTLKEIRAERIKKLDKLFAQGIAPYPARTERNCSIRDALNSFEKTTKGDKKIPKKLTLAGRVMARRIHGGVAFADIFDGTGTGTIQLILKKDDLSGELFDQFINLIDIGDFIEATGELMLSKRDERSLAVHDWKILTKSLLPLPDKWHGLQDTEDKLRKRYLDILFDPHTKELIYARSRFWQSIRSFLLDRDFLEVETPILENTTGGADARPFVTHHNALDLELQLRISMGELWQKRLMVAGFPKTFEIGRQFRNEGMSPEHLQDYTQMEFYWAYANYIDGMELTKELYRHIAEETFGTRKFIIGTHEVDLDHEWERYDFLEIIERMTGVRVLETTEAEIQLVLNHLKIEYEKTGFNITRGIDNLWKYCRKQLAGPGFLVNVPVFMEPLAKRMASNPALVERFQIIIAGSELGKGYSELNDPLDQASRFEEQQKLREAGDAEAQQYDHDFVEALEYGMPPTCGFGLSERLFAFLANRPARECQIFPLLRPKN